MDDLACSITYADFVRKTLHVLKLARAALIYLFLGMHREEQRRRVGKKSGMLKASMPLDPWQDDWKQ